MDIMQSKLQKAHSL